jgi:hypothetical protein
MINTTRSRAGALYMANSGAAIEEPEWEAKAACGKLVP